MLEVLLWQAKLQAMPDGKLVLVVLLWCAKLRGLSNVNSVPALSVLALLRMWPA
jgi:hypothetical protein